MSYYRCTRCGDELPDGCDMHGCLARHEAMVDELTRLRAEVEAYKVDAERYTYLRSRQAIEVLTGRGPSAGVWCDMENERGTLVLLTGRDLDAEVDAARAALNQETKP